MMKSEVILKIKEEVEKQLKASFLTTIAYLDWVTNIVPVPKKDRKVMILGKIITLRSSMMGWPDLRPQHMEVRTRKFVLSLAGRTNFRHPRPLAKPRPE